ncbi:MAG: replication initiator protein [Microviridae sp.]|nr:MAG: replication initiator protein [Microviridae sp.]
MCISPSYIWKEQGPKWVQLPVPCRRCWMCAQNRVNDLVGRALCEAAYSDWTVTVSLTYADRDDGADKILTPRHFQEFIKNLRNERRGHPSYDKNHKLRYIVVGEYGDLKGRSHFHAVLFGEGPPLDISKNNREPWPHHRRFWPSAWDHGHVWADHNSDEKSLRYVCKYLLKNEPGKYWFSLSKKPTLGSAFFKERAALCAELGVLPSAFSYSPPGSSRTKNYLMTGATRRDFLQDVIDRWREKRPLDSTRLSEWMAEAVRKLDVKAHEARYNALPDAEKMEALLESLEHKRPSDRAVLRSLLDTLDFHDY